MPIGEADARGAARAGLYASRRYLAVTVIVFVAYLIAGKLGQATTHIRSGNLGPVWPAYGVALAAVVLYGTRVWPALSGAAFLVALSSPVPFLTAAGQAAGATIAAVTGGALLRRIGFDRSFSRLRDALQLILLGALASAIVSATIGVSVLYATGMQAYDGIASAWLIYWFGDSTGVLLITPLALTAPMRSRSAIVTRPGEFGALLLCLTVACFVIFGDLPMFSVTLHVLAFAVLPFIIWAAIRFGVLGVTVAVLIVAVIATVETALGSGPFSQSSAFTNAVLLDVFFAVLSVSGITLAAVITEREHVEVERARLVREQAALEAVREAENQVAALREELVHLGRVAMLDALAGSLAHEINQPLTAVTANAEAALHFLAASSPPLAELRDTLTDIRNDNQRAGDVVRRMRTLLKKEATRQEPFDVSGAVVDVVKLISGNAVSRRIAIDLDLAADLAPVLGDRTQFQQVLLNLLLNACDAVQDAEPQRRRVSLRAEQRARMALFQVRDRGAGLSDGEIARVFEPFYTTKRDGMGLGLSICRTIVQAHGGTLDAMRNADQGMTFSATFPTAN
jgi:signal transduction histidine kinase